MKSLNIRYVPAVDHLRGFAALLIFFYHCVTLVGHRIEYGEPFNFTRWKVAANPFSALLFEGHTAVSLFIVLSGFIFTIGSYQSHLRYFEFVRNRFLRTYPLFVLILLTGVFAFPDKFNVGGFVQTLMFMGNLPGALNAGSLSSMFWAVAVEWQFYLVFPFIILYLNLYGVKYLFGLIAVFIIMRCFAGLMGANIRDLSYWTIIGRMDQFLAGICAGVVYRRYFQAGVKFDILFLVSSLFMLILIYVFNQMGGWPNETKFKIIWPTIEGFAWAGFILGYLSIARWLPQRMSSLLIALGTISYSIYLTHFAVVDICIRNNFLLILPRLTSGQNVLLIALLYMLPAVLLISTLTYHIVEKPFLQMRHAYIDQTADNRSITGKSNDEH